MIEVFRRFLRLVVKRRISERRARSIKTAAVFRIFVPWHCSDQMDKPHGTASECDQADRLPYIHTRLLKSSLARNQIPHPVNYGTPLFSLFPRQNGKDH